MSTMPSKGELKRNLKALKDRLDERPMDLDARMRTARTYRLLERGPDAVAHYAAVARYLSLAGHPLQAIAVLKELLQVDPQHEESLLFLAKLYARTRAADQSNRGRIAVPILDTPSRPDEMIDVAALPEGLPSTTTGIWRAIRPASAESLAVVHDPDDVGVEVDVSISVPNADALIVDEQPDVVVALSPEERFLQGTSLFSALRPEALIELSHAMVMLRAPAGSVLFEQGEPGDSCLVIVKGRAVVTRMVRGEDVFVVELGEGDVAGLFALMATRDRQATVVAKTDVEYYEIDQAALEDVLRAHPAARAPLQHFFRERLLVNVVTTLPFFAGQNPDQRKDLIERFVDKVYEDGDELVFEGSEGDGLWVLIDGVVAVGREGERGFEERARIGAGDFLGSLAGSHGAAADLSAVARKATRAAHLSHKHFAPWLQAGLPPATETLHHAGWMVGAHLFAGSGLLPRTRR